MYSETPDQRLLCEAFDVPGFARSLQTMKEDNLCPRSAFGLMLHNQDSGARTGIVDFPSRWESALIDLAGPEIPRNRQQMRVPQKRYEFAIHESIVTRATYWHSVEEGFETIMMMSARRMD
jgi:hypothetical protein